MINKNSLLYWYNRINHLDIPMPVTLFSGIDDIESVKQNASDLGYPCFLRTDLCSGKHDWKTSCYIPDKESVEINAKNVLSANIRWKMLGIEPQAFVVRQFLQLESTFSAFIGDMPINKERRYFINNDVVVCSHPYWPENAFNNHPSRMVNDKNLIDWKDKLLDLNKIEETESILTEYSKKVGKVLGGCWSVDFARDLNKKWWLIDMALSENSYHYPHTEID